MKSVSVLLIVGLMAVAGCGGDDETPPTGGQQRAAATSTQTDVDDASAKTHAEDPATPVAVTRDATKITVGKSQFGAMLFNSKKQAIYVFEQDPARKSVCYGDCATAWPPVFTDGEPVAGKGVKTSLLSTVKRRGGKRQATYAGQPLYYYAHESPGEVRCHNVNLNGGLWWVIGPNGKPRP